MAELDRFIKMIPGYATKKVYVNLNKLAQAFMGAESGQTQDKGLIDEEVDTTRMRKKPFIQGEPSGEGEGQESN